MAVAVSCDLSGWGTLSFVHPCQHLWAIAQEDWRTKRCLGCTSGYCFSGLAPSPDSLCGLWQVTHLLVSGKNMGTFVQTKPHSHAWSSATIPMLPMPDDGGTPMPPALLLDLPWNISVLCSSVPNSRLAGWESTDDVLFCVWSPQGLILPNDLRACLTALLKTQPLEEQCYSFYCQPWWGDLSLVSGSNQEPLNKPRPSPQQTWWRCWRKAVFSIFAVEVVPLCIK